MSVDPDLAEHIRRHFADPDAPARKTPIRLSFEEMYLGALARAAEAKWRRTMDTAEQINHEIDRAIHPDNMSLSDAISTVGIIEDYCRTLREAMENELANLDVD